VWIVRNSQCVQIGAMNGSGHVTEFDLSPIRAAETAHSNKNKTRSQHLNERSNLPK
jgi:hypothetical protein